MTRHILNQNRIHEGNNCEANYFHRYYFCEERQYAMTKGLGKGVYYNLESGHDLLGPLYSIINLWFTTGLLSRREMATVKGHSNAESEKSRNNMAGETMKANTNCRLFLLFCLERILIKIQKRPHQMHVLCFICETSWDLGPTLLVQSVSWGGVCGWGIEMGYELRLKSVLSS